MTPIARPATLLAVVATALLMAAAPAQAIFIETPLHLTTPDHAEVGDTVDIVVGPNNDSAKEDFAGKDVGVGFSYDKNESGGGPDAPTDDSGYTEGTILDRLTLDGSGRATFSWTIPAEVDDRNVNLFLTDAAGARIAFAFIAVGNATPMMHLMNGPADGEPEIDPLQDDDTESAREASALGSAAVALALSALVAVARRRD